MRVALLGMAPLPFEEALRHHAPGIRAWQLARPLLRDGHRVRLLLCRYPEAYPSAVPPRTTLACPEGDGSIDLLTPAAFDAAILDGILAEEPFDVVVGVTVRPAARAARLPGGHPCWADLLGHTLGEGQAKAILHGDDGLLLDYVKQEVQVLLRADVVSAVSHAQRLAVLGELGILGRLNAATAGYRFVEVIPCAGLRLRAAAAAAIRGQVVPKGAFLVLWSGGFNTWVDAPTLLEGLELAMDRSADLHFVSTGGELTGQNQETYPWFVAAAARSRHRSRLHLLGWVEAGVVEQCHREADIALNVDRDIAESWLGGRNRIPMFLAHGLHVVTSRGTEVSDDVARLGAGTTFPAGNPRALADVLVAMAGSRDEVQRRKPEIAAIAARELSCEATAGPLLAFAAAPRRAPDAGHASALGAKMAGLADALDAKDEALAALRASLAEAGTHVRNLEHLVAEKSAALEELRRFERRVRATIPFRVRDSLRRILWPQAGSTGAQGSAGHEMR